MICEKCWGDAYLESRLSHGDQGDIYRRIVLERTKAGKICSPQEQAGQWWDESNQCDSRDDTEDSTP